jgi:hypothetical protein
MNIEKLNELIEKLTQESRDLALSEILNIVNNPEINNQKLIFWLIRDKAVTIKNKGLNNATDMELVLLESHYKKLC